jgi:hypothetical protein
MDLPPPSLLRGFTSRSNQKSRTEHGSTSPDSPERTAPRAVPESDVDGPTPSSTPTCEHLGMRRISTHRRPGSADGSRPADPCRPGTCRDRCRAARKSRARGGRSRIPRSLPRSARDARHELASIPPEPEESLISTLRMCDGSGQTQVACLCTTGSRRPSSPYALMWHAWVGTTVPIDSSERNRSARLPRSAVAN